MGYLAKKTIKGRDYYYYMESKRVDGKPRHSTQLYLGSVDDVLEKLRNSTTPQPPLFTKDLAFGAVAALWDLVQRLRLPQMLDACAPKRKQGLSESDYLLCAILNRAVAPVSKSHLEEWYTSTMLSQWMPTEKGELSAQRYWDNTQKWTQQSMDAFEILFIKKLVETYSLSPKCLIYDATNFHTYIDTDNEKADLAKRGHHKQKRNDLRIIGLSMLISDEEIPLFYEVYPGNQPDSRQFAEVVEKLKGKYQAVFGQEAEITLIFDRGNNSQDNFDELADPKVPFHYVAGLTRSQSQTFYDIPMKDYQPATLEDLRDVSYVQKQEILYGREHTLVVCKNPELEKGQLQGIYITVEKCNTKLQDLSDNLQDWRQGLKKKGRKPTRESMERKIEGILSGPYMKELFIVSFLEDDLPIPQFTFVFSEAALEHLRIRELGKMVFFTDREDWDAQTMIRRYRSAWKIEHAFRQMKDTEYLSVRPMWHWTDAQIRVHFFCCVMALRLCAILKLELGRKGIHISMHRMLETLEKKKQFIHYYPQKRGVQEVYSLSEPMPEVDELFHALDLEKYVLKS